MNPEVRPPLKLMTAGPSILNGSISRLVAPPSGVLQSLPWRFFLQPSASKRSGCYGRWPCCGEPRIRRRFPESGHAARKTVKRTPAAVDVQARSMSAQGSPIQKAIRFRATISDSWPCHKRAAVNKRTAFARTRHEARDQDPAPQLRHGRQVNADQPAGCRPIKPAKPFAFG